MSAKKTKWEVKLHEAREMRKRGAELLFDRVVLLVECYEDEQFRAWCSETETNDVDYLDEELSDTAAAFMTLKAVLHQYPTRDEWVKHNIRVLIAQVLQEQAEATKRDGEEKRISWKERALAAEKECERLRAELANMKESLGIVAGAKCV
jgi:squalene cyclase